MSAVRGLVARSWVRRSTPQAFATAALAAIEQQIAVSPRSSSPPAEQHQERARVRLQQELLEQLLLEASATPSTPSAVLVDFLEHGMMLGLFAVNATFRALLGSPLLPELAPASTSRPRGGSGAARLLRVVGRFALHLSPMLEDGGESGAEQPGRPHEHGSHIHRADVPAAGLALSLLLRLVQISAAAAGDGDRAVAAAAAAAADEMLRGHPALAPLLRLAAHAEPKQWSQLLAVADDQCAEDAGEAADGAEGGQGQPASPPSASPPLPHGLRGRISALPQLCWLAPRPEGSGSRLRSLVGHRLLLHDAASSGGPVPAPPLDGVSGACGLAQQLRVHLDGKAASRPPFGGKAAEGGETPDLAARQHLEAQAQQLAVAVSALATEAATMTVAAAAALQPLAVECGALCSAVLRTLQLKSHHPAAAAAALQLPPTVRP
eukprot:COSAG01_NODE_11830_length_1851_cov_2.465183_1_plen_436_part_00